MKVLQINSVCGIRSTGRICTDIADVLAENGNECLIVYGREQVPDKYKSISVRADTTLGVRMHALQSRFFDNAGFSRKKATQKLINWIREYNPDVIHLHNLHGYYINVEVLFDYLKQCGKPVVWTLHDCWAFTGHCTYFTIVGCEKWKTGCKECLQTHRYPKNIFFDRSPVNYQLKKTLFTGVDNLYIVTPSQWLAGLVQESFLDKYPVRVIHNGIDVSTFKPRETGDIRAKFGIPVEKRLILGVSSCWDAGKGYCDFFRLAKMLDERYCMVMVGVSDKQMKELPDNIIGIGKTDNAKELAELYSACDIFVNPTYEDNYPTVNIEAQACGTPAVTYKTGGSVESVPVSHVVECGNIEGIRDLLVNRYEETKNEVLSLKSFDRRMAFEEYLKLYESITIRTQGDKK